MTSVFPTLSLCMIVKNEATRLAECLASVGDLAVDICIVDTGSTDGTPALAAQLGAKVSAFAWSHDFAAARNAALSQVSGDWVLVLDADETLTDAGRVWIDQVLHHEMVAGVATSDILLVTWLRQEVGAAQSPYSQVSRLFRNRPELRFCRPYHETIDESVESLLKAEPHWQIVQASAVAMRHTGYSADAIANQAKFQRAQAILEGYLAEHPEDAYACNKLGALYGEQGDWAKGLRLIQKGLTSGLSGETLDPNTQYELFYHAGIGHRALNQWDVALGYYQQAIRCDVGEPLKLGAYLNLGALLKQQGQLRSAVEMFEVAIAIDPTQAIAHYNLGVTWRSFGELTQAINAYHQAITHQPHYPEAYQNLGVALFKQGQLTASRHAFQRAIEQYQETEPNKAVKLQLSIQQLGL
jgi:tetratricopeptide (TPR) repeat protein